MAITSPKPVPKTSMALAMLFNSVATAALLLRCHSVSQVIVAILLWIGQPSCPNAVCGVNFHPKTMGPHESWAKAAISTQTTTTWKIASVRTQAEKCQGWTFEHRLCHSLGGAGWGSQCSILSTKWLWDHFSSLQNGRGHRKLGTSWRTKWWCLSTVIFERQFQSAINYIILPWN